MNNYLQKRCQKCYSLNAGFNLGLATRRGSLKCPLFYIFFLKRYQTSSTLAGSRELEVLKRPLPGAAANTFRVHGNQTVLVIFIRNSLLPVFVFILEFLRNCRKTNCVYNQLLTDRNLTVNC